MTLLRLKPWKAEYLKKPLPSYSLLIISISSPILMGLYKDDKLIEIMSTEKKTSEILLPMIMDCLDKYDIQKIIYTRGPGSYMSIKLTYIMLKTIEITRGIQCFGCSGFTLNNNQAIKAIGNLYFIKEKETIITKKYKEPPIIKFTLPQSIYSLKLDKESTPDYVLPAV